MAKVLSHLHSIMRGSVAGVTYTANQFAQIVMRQKTVPVNPGTEGQSMIRSAFASSAEIWKSMTQAFRDSWDDYAQTLTFQGPLGSYKVPGRQIAMSNIALAIFMEEQAIGSVASGDQPPVLAGFLDIGPVVVAQPVTASSTGIGYSVTNNSGEAITVFAQRSIGFDPSRGRYKGPWLFQHNSGVDIALETSGIGEFIGLETGAAYFMRIIAISQAQPLRISAEYFLRMIAVDIGP